jgi:hypothetical protein
MTGVTFAVALVTCGGSALAVDQALVGKKLLILNPLSGPTNNKVVYLSKDASIALPADATEDPRCPAAGSNSSQLTVRSVTSGENFTIALPCGNWTVNGAGHYRYKDASGATCKIVLIKGGKLSKAVCKGSQVNYDLTAVDQTKVDVILRAGSAPRRWCASFSALPNVCDVVKNGADGKKYLAKNCTTATPCGASPSGAFLDTASPF